MNNNVIDAVIDRKDIQESIDLLSDVCDKHNRVDYSLNLLTDCEELTINDKALLYSKVVARDSDAIDVTCSTDVESIKDKLLENYRLITSLFKSTRQKLFEATEKSRNIWVADNRDNIKMVRDDLSLKQNRKSIDNGTLATANKIMNNNLSTINTSKLDLDDLVLLAKNMTESFRLDTTIKIDELVGKYIKRKDNKIVGSDYLKVTRVDGKNISYIVIGNTHDVRGIKYYDSIKIDSKEPVLTKENFTVEYAKKLLDTAEEINKILPDIGSSIRDELASVEDSIKDISDKSKWETTDNGMTIGTLSMYVGGALLVAFGIYSGGLPIIVNMIKTVGLKSMSFLSQIISGYMRLGSRAKAVIGSISIAYGVGVTSKVVPANISKWFKSTSKELDTDMSYYRELEDKAKIKLLNARVELTTKYSLDAIYGMYFLVVELISTASIITEYLDNKGDE